MYISIKKNQIFSLKKNRFVKHYDNYILILYYVRIVKLQRKLQNLYILLITIITYLNIFIIILNVIISMYIMYTLFASGVQIPSIPPQNFKIEPRTSVCADLCSNLEF